MRRGCGPMTLKQKFQNEIETASLNLGDVPSWGVLIFGEGQALKRRKSSSSVRSCSQCSQIERSCSERQCRVSWRKSWELQALGLYLMPRIMEKKLGVTSTRPVPRLVRPLPVTLPNRAKLQRHAIPRNIEKELAVSTRPVAQLVRALS